MKKKQTADTKQSKAKQSKRKLTISNFYVYKSQLHVRGSRFQEVPNNFSDLTWKLLVFHKTGC